MTTESRYRIFVGPSKTCSPIFIHPNPTYAYVPGLARFVAGHGDFFEGVKANLVHRGRKPSWKYSSVGVVPTEVVKAFFEEAVSSKM